MVRDKVRIRFRKTGPLRLVSHHDLMRCFERMLRRAALPVHVTQGFHPKPRLVFALSLPLGVVGCEEVVELELDEELPPDEVHARLARQAPPGLEIASARRISSKSVAQPRSICYRVEIPESLAADTAAAARRVLADTQCMVERTKPEPRRIDIRPFLRHLRVEGGYLEMELWVTPKGTARPDEVLGLVGLGSWLDLGTVLERTRLEIHDEITEPACAEGNP
jgi:radical SAM-linked protein